MTMQAKVITSFKPGFPKTITMEELFPRQGIALPVF
jgi:hypothetical protein